jgi:hypothetical protein
MEDKKIEKAKPKISKKKKIIISIIALLILVCTSLAIRDVRSWMCRETAGNICINILPQPANNTKLINN